MPCDTVHLNENVWIPIKISLKFVPKGPINNIPALVQIMAWRRTGDKPLSEPMMTQFNGAYMRHSASMSQGYLNRTEVGRQLPQCQWSKPEAWMDFRGANLFFCWGNQNNVQQLSCKMTEAINPIQSVLTTLNESCWYIVYIMHGKTSILQRDYKYCWWWTNQFNFKVTGNVNNIRCVSAPLVQWILFCIIISSSYSLQRLMSKVAKWKIFKVNGNIGFYSIITYCYYYSGVC